MNNMLTLTIVVIIYLSVVGFLGYCGYRRTKSALDYLVAGRDIHPFVMSISYGASAISTSAIIGFGGAAALFGLSLLWLTFLTVLFGIIVAFIVFGKRTRKIGHRLDAHTFPEFLGRRFKSRFIQGASALVIFLFMPLYAAVVLIGAARFIETTFFMNFNVALLIYTLIICAYVISGGLKGTMYIDAFQGTIMFIGMIILLAITYLKLGGVAPAHQALSQLATQVPDKLARIGHLGWTRMPALGSNIWWTMITTFVMGVGVGVLAQPYLAVRFMTVKSAKELNRAVGMGGVFFLCIIGAAFIVGALSNVHFFNDPKFGQISLAVSGGNIDKIIPLYINSALPAWFVYVFTLVILSAAMSSSGSQFQALGAAIGRDFFERAILGGRHNKYTVLATRIGIVLGVLFAVILGYSLPGNIIAVGTAIFFGICASVFLPSYIGALFWKGMTKAGVIASMAVGFLGTAFWLLFIHQKESEALGLCKFIFNKPSLAPFPWTVIDAIAVIMPISFVTAVLVSLFTKKLPQEHIDNCFNLKPGK
ncbi:MAG: sodium:solute symporter family protein [Candidatus Omnitrophica bacterium]|nr:sodium:solute symporter family protein [Candidatus Omnitrophota bacterium]